MSTGRRTVGRSVRFGFLGAGWVASRALAPAVHAARGAVLQAVAARDAGRAAALEPAGRVHAGPDAYRTLLDDPAVDVVYVNLTNEAHLRWTLAALVAGKHVLCEKPLGLDPGEVDAMVAAARKADRLLVEALWYRWHPRIRRLAQLVGSGALGPVHEVDAQFTFTAAWSGQAPYRLDPARGGGARYDTGCYLASAAHLLLGEHLQVRSATSVPGPTGVDLTATAELVVPAVRAGESRARARLHCGLAGPDRQALVVRGASGSAWCGQGEAFTSWREASTLMLTRGAGGSGQDVVERFPAVDAYQLMVESVAAAVRGREAFLPATAHSQAVARTLAAWRGAPPAG